MKDGISTMGVLGAEHSLQPVAYLAWFDFEMTGLDPEADSFLEIAGVVTRTDLVAVGSGFQIVCRRPGLVLSELHDEVYRMHVQSGLVNEVKLTKITEEEAQCGALTWLNNLCKDAPLLHCGYYLDYDRLLLARRMPELARRLGYRCLDIRALEEAAEAWTSKGRFPRQVRRVHRAMADVEEALMLARLYRASYFERR